MHAFRAAVEAKDVEAAVALLADDVVFRSPVVFTPYEGREAVATILRAAFATFEGFAYTRDIGDDVDHALVFRAHVGDIQLEGVDVLHCDDTGAIDELVVLVRPMKGVLALAAAMKERLTPAG